MIHRTLFAACFWAMFVTFCGCGGREYDGPVRYSLKGKVTVDGQPMEYGTISFLPPQGVEDMRVSGGPIVNGQYEVPEAQGANAGTYRVEIRWQKPTGRKVKDIDSDQLVDMRAEGLPPKYHSQSELSVEIPFPENTHDFDLSTK